MCLALDHFEHDFISALVSNRVSLEKIFFKCHNFDKQIQLKKKIDK